MKKPQVRPRKLLWFPVLTALVFLLGSFRPATRISAHDYSYIINDTSTSPVSAPAGAYSAKSFISEKMDVFDSLHLAEWGLSKKVFEMGLRGMYKLVRTGYIKSNILSIVDFSQPSTSKRLYVIDLDNYSLLYNTWVAHGAKTGKNSAAYFSNKPSSHKSSLGFYVTGETYNGSNGYSLKLQGMEKGINDFALRRGIVMHGADYVSEEYIENQGYIGRSYGCPAIAAGISQELIDMVKDGTCLFIYHPTSSYRSKSRLIK
jgi:hypothetical protein